MDKISINNNKQKLVNNGIPIVQRGELEEL